MSLKSAENRLYGLRRFLFEPQITPKVNWKIALPLALVGILSVLIRMYPTMGNFAFGNDFGIYSTIARDFVNSGKIFETFHSPWGGAGYGDFPVMYWIVIGLSKISGLNYSLILIKAPPVFGGLCSIIIYFIAYRLTGNEIVSLLSAVFDAVNPVIAYQTSISSILVFGHFFGLLTVLFFIYYLDDSRYVLPFMVTGILMVMSHPLSTAMYLLAIIGISLVHLSHRQKFRERLKLAAALYFLSTFMFAYWSLFFRGFADFMSGGILGLPAPLIIFTYYTVVTLILFFPLDILPELRTRFNRNLFKGRIEVLYASLAAYASIVIVSITTILKLIRSITPLDTLAFMPLILDGGLAIVGMHFARGSLKKIVSGWLLLTGLSLLYSVLTWNTVLYPGRYIEYIFEPLSLLEAAGVVGILAELKKHNRRKHSKEVATWARDEIVPIRKRPTGLKTLKRSLLGILHGISGRYSKMNTFVAILLLFCLIAASAATPLQVGNMVTPSGNQAISLQDYEAAKWLQYNADRNYSVATDHILGLMVDGFNFTGTFEKINQTWSQPSFGNGSLHELMGKAYSPSQNYSPVDYILIDNYMLNKGVWGHNGLANPYEKPVLMTNRSFGKFFSLPFVPVFFSNTSTGNWAIVFQVNWTYINSEFGTNIPVGNLTMFHQIQNVSFIINETTKSG